MLYLVGFFIISCKDENIIKKGNAVIAIQPYRDFKQTDAQFIHQQIQKVYSQTILLPGIDLPQQAYVQIRNRYRADSLIRMLRDSRGKDTISVGLTHFDISTTKNGIPDWGVMGLGYRPGRACVISTFRLKKKNLNEQLLKVVLHEIGHTQNLPHCENQSCLMRDAEGGNPLDQEKEFCTKCKQALRQKGLLFNE